MTTDLLCMLACIMIVVSAVQFLRHVPSYTIPREMELFIFVVGVAVPALAAIGFGVKMLTLIL